MPAAVDRRLSLTPLLKLGDPGRERARSDAEDQRGRSQAAGADSVCTVDLPDGRRRRRTVYGSVQTRMCTLSLAYLRRVKDPALPAVNHHRRSSKKIFPFFYLAFPYVNACRRRPSAEPDSATEILRSREGEGLKRRRGPAGTVAGGWPRLSMYSGLAERPEAAPERLGKRPDSNVHTQSRLFTEGKGSRPPCCIPPQAKM